MRLTFQFIGKRPCAFVAATLAILAITGCRSLDAPNDLAALDAKIAPSSKDEPTIASDADVAKLAAAQADDEPPAEKSEVTVEARPKPPAAPMSEADADALLVLLEDNWHLELGAESGFRYGAYRWRHLGTEQLASAPVAERPELTNFLSSDDRVVSANAAIMLARANDSVADLHLVDAVRDATLKLSVRCAAAEALGRPDSVLASIALAELIEEYGDAGAAQYSPELHAELLRSLGRQVDASASPQLQAALKSNSADVRAAAIDSFATDLQGQLPPGLVAMRGDPHPQVRAAVLTCLVARRDPQAQEYCLAGLGDVHLNVQLASIAGLGTLGGDEACLALGRLANQESESVRAAAIAALAAVGDDVAVFAAAKDPSWHVRRNVATGLARFPSERGAGVARSLLADSNAEVRHAVIEAIASWSLPQAGPILLAAMAETPQPTRDQAAALLTARWPEASHFTPNGPPELRQDQVLRLQTAWDAGAAAPIQR